MLEAIGAGSGRQIGNKDWADIWADSQELVEVKQRIQELKAEGLAMPEDTDPSLKNEYSTPFLTQLKVVSTRTFMAFWRSPDYGFTRLFNHISIALVVGLTVRLTPERCGEGVCSPARSLRAVPQPREFGGSAPVPRLRHLLHHGHPRKCVPVLATR